MAARILLVEEEKIVLDLFSTIIGADHHVDSAVDAKSGLEKIAEIKFDVVICDYRLGGEEFRRRAIEIQPSLEQRFAFTAADIDEGTKRQLVLDSGVHVLVKPFVIGEIKALVTSLLENATAG